MSGHEPAKVGRFMVHGPSSIQRSAFGMANMAVLGDLVGVSNHGRNSFGIF